MKSPCRTAQAVPFYAIPDGSYLLGRDGRETLFGEAHRIRDGRMEQAGWENEALALS